MLNVPEFPAVAFLVRVICVGLSTLSICVSSGMLVPVTTHPGFRLVVLLMLVTNAEPFVLVPVGNEADVT